MISIKEFCTLTKQVTKTYGDNLVVESFHCYDEKVDFYVYAGDKLEIIEAYKDGRLKGPDPKLVKKTMKKRYGSEKIGKADFNRAC